MHLSVFFAWYDFWIGVFVDLKKHCVYVCPLPCIVFRFDWGVFYFAKYDPKTQDVRYIDPNLNWLERVVRYLFNRKRDDKD
jgi:hypothetical protein